MTHDLTAYPAYSSSSASAPRAYSYHAVAVRFIAAAALSVTALSGGVIVHASGKNQAIGLGASLPFTNQSQQVAATPVAAAFHEDGSWAVAGDYNAYVAVDAQAGRAFAIGQQGSGTTLTVIDARTGVRRGSVPLAGSAIAEIVDQAAHRLAVLVQFKGLEIFDSRTGAYLRTITAAKLDNGLAVSPGGARIIAFGGARGGIPLTLIDAASGSIVTSPRVGITPSAIRFDAPNRRTFVLSVNDNLLTEFDTLTGTVIASQGVAETPESLAVDSVQGRVFVVAPNESKIEAYQDPKAYPVDEQQLVQTPIVSPDALVVDPGANRMVLANRNGSSTVFSEQPLHVLGSTMAGVATTAPAIDRIDGTAIVTIAQPALSMVIRLRDGTEEAVEQLTGPAKQIATDPALPRAYIVGDGTSGYTGPNGSPAGSGYIAVTSGATGAQLALLHVGALPSIVAISVPLKRVYVDEYLNGYSTLATFDLMGQPIARTRLSQTRYSPGHD